MPLAIPTSYAAGVRESRNIYEIPRSLRVASALSTYMSRTFSTPTNSKIWTLSFYLKRGLLGTSQVILGAHYSTGVSSFIRLETTDKIIFHDFNAQQFLSDRVFRDPGYYAITIAVDTTNPVQSERFRLYVNGDRASGTCSISLNAVTSINSAKTHGIGASSSADTPFTPVAGLYLDGHLSDFYFIDGQALDPDSFGYRNSVGRWKPKKYIGTYGNNGCYLPFSNGTSTTTLGLDQGSNSNNWTPTNLVRDGSKDDCWTQDTPTNSFAILNTITGVSGLTISNGGLKISASASGTKIAPSTIKIPATGKWSFEWRADNTSNSTTGYQIGVMTETRSLTAAYNAADSYHFYVSNLTYLFNNGSQINPATVTLSIGEIIQVVADVDNSKIWIGRNNVWYDSAGGTTGDPNTGANPTFSVSAANMFFYVGLDVASAVSGTANFGQISNFITPPNGFRPLCTKNLPLLTR